MKCSRSTKQFLIEHLIDLDFIKPKISLKMISPHVCWLYLSLKSICMNAGPHLEIRWLSLHLSVSPSVSVPRHAFLPRALRKLGLPQSHKAPYRWGCGHYLPVWQLFFLLLSWCLSLSPQGSLQQISFPHLTLPSASVFTLSSLHP